MPLTVSLLAVLPILLTVPGQNDPRTVSRLLAMWLTYKMLKVGYVLYALSGRYVHYWSTALILWQLIPSLALTMWAENGMPDGSFVPFLDLSAAWKDIGYKFRLSILLWENFSSFASMHCFWIDNTEFALPTHCSYERTINAVRTLRG